MGDIGQSGKGLREPDLDLETEGPRLAAQSCKATSKAKPYLDVPLQSTFTRSPDTLSDVFTYSADNENERSPSASGSTRLLSRPLAPQTWRDKLQECWTTNKGLALVILAQLFGVMMNVTTRLLEMDGSHGSAMHPFQVYMPIIDSVSRLKDSKIVSDTVRPHDWYPYSQQHISVARQSRKCSFWLPRHTKSLDCTRCGRLLWCIRYLL